MEADYSLLQDPDMKDIFDSFIVETVELLEKLDLDLVELEQRPDDPDLLNDIFRSFHTVKGTSGFLGLVKLQKLTHKCEDILNKLRKGEAQLDDDTMDVILHAYDSMKALLEVIETNLNESLDLSEDLDALQKTIERMEAGGGAPAPTAEAAPEAEPQAEETPEEAESPAPVESASEEGVAEEHPAPDPEDAAEQMAAPEPVKEEAEPELPEPESVPIPNAPTDTLNVQEKMKADTEKKKEPPARKPGKADHKMGDNTIRVDVERLDELLNIVSELVLGRNRLTQIHNEASQEYEGTQIARDLAETSRQIDLRTTDLQLAVMKTRMVKIGKVFNKFPRLVRDLSKETNKKIKLDIHGEDTELDKTLIEEINDPLVHLVRNSIDHGVETPAERKAKGKDETGTVTLAAEHEGNNIVIIIEDDGKGINPDVIKNKAIEKGVLSEAQAKELTQKETFDLIFAPGFSTAQQVTNISGRGVGMDVVKTNITKLRGVINIESEVDKGTRILIKLPLTLAIIQGLLVSVFGETLVIPLSSVIEVIRVTKEHIKKVNQKEVIKLRESVLPLVNIESHLYNVPEDDEREESQYVVVVGIAERKFGIKVDSLIGQREVVIKSLGAYLGNVEGIAGSTIMGDGSVVMILDLAELLQKMNR